MGDSQYILIIAAVCSALAAAFSALTLALDTWKRTLKSKKPKISILNDENVTQRARLIPFSKMPQEFKNKWAQYTGEEAGYAALVRLLLSNEGDGDGYVVIDDVEVLNAPAWKISYYSQTVVGAKGYHIHDILIRGLPNLEIDTYADIKIRVLWGGHRETTIITKTLKIKLEKTKEMAGIDDHSKQTIESSKDRLLGESKIALGEASEKNIDAVGRNQKA